MKIEQRLYPRCSTWQAELRIFSHETKIIGQLVNIGQKGLAFRYTPQPGITAVFNVIDLFKIDSKRWHLPGIACKCAYDISVLAENQTFTGSETRLCGLQFMRLTWQQKEELAIILEQCEAETITIR